MSTSLYILGLMPFVVLMLGLVVSLIVIGGISDANVQAKKLHSKSTRPDEEQATDQSDSIIRFDDRQVS